MRRLIRPFLDRPGLSAAACAVLLLLGLLADLATPLLPALPILALLAPTGLGAGFAAARLRPDAAWPHGLLTFAAILTLGFGLGAAVQQVAPAPRGLAVLVFDDLAALQDAVLGHPPDSPEAFEALRAALAAPGAAPRPRPASADEFLFNALLLRAEDQPVRSAQALAEALRRGAEPRPDAVLLYPGLLATGLPAVTEALGSLPAGLGAAARAQLEALRIAAPQARAAALTAILEDDPENLLAAAALAEALVAASLPQGPTIATAARIAAVVEAFEDPTLTEPLAARFLQPAGAARLADSMAALAWTRDLALRRLSVAALAAPPGLPNAPILLRVTPPEPATGVQFVRTLDGEGVVWAEVPQRNTAAERDPVPTLRITRPWRPQEFRFRHLDRDGVASEPVAYAFDPATAIREAAQRQLARQGPFALYQPGRMSPGRLNPLAIPGNLRAGLIAVEWFTDADRRVRNQPVGVPDEVILAGDVPRIVVELPVPAGARTLSLVAIFADGSRSATAEMPIR
jgi:hypothetical protein